MTEQTQQLTIKPEQIKTIIDSGYEPPTATLIFVSTPQESYFEVEFRLSSGIDVKFVGTRNEIRKFNNPMSFMRTAQKLGIKIVKFRDISLKNVHFTKTGADDDVDGLRP